MRHGALTQRGSKTISAAHLSGRFINITNHLSHQSHELHCVLVLILQDKKKKTFNHVFPFSCTYNIYIYIP